MNVGTTAVALAVTLASVCVANAQPADSESSLDDNAAGASAAPLAEALPPVELPALPVAPDPAAPAALATTSKLELGKGITFKTTDDAARMTIRARLQLRGSQFSGRDGDAPEISEFQARRIRLLLQGHVAGGDATYYLQLGFANQDTEPDLRLPLRDAYVTYTRVRDLNIRGGQMKVPFGRQRVISSSALQFADRSIVTQELNLDRDVGVQLMSEDLAGMDGKLGYNLGVFSGDGRNRLAEAPGVLLVGRILVRPFGGFADNTEADHDREDSFKLALGVGGAHNNNTNRQRSTFNDVYEVARFDYWHAGADLVIKYRGLSVLSEIMYRKSPRTSVIELVDGETLREYARNAWGYYAQAGYLVTDEVEVSARYGELRPRGATDPRLAETRREAGGGLSWYFQEHDLKLQSDYFYLFGEDGEGRHQARVQMQLYF
jgi:phosphate-selective porin OprO and OprP